MSDTQHSIEVSIAGQWLRLLADGERVKQYPVSTARNGPGELLDSACTPRGQHEIAEKIGHDCEPNTVFVGRKANGEIYQPHLREKEPGRDWILTRILWLRGLEPDVNLHGNVDSFNRYIYLHGTPDDVDITVPGSGGCIRMRNKDIVELFDLVDEGTRVVITED